MLARSGWVGRQSSRICPYHAAGRADQRRWLLMVVDQFGKLFTQCPDEQPQTFLTAAAERHGGELARSYALCGADASCPPPLKTSL
jgi:hypothetical protein